MNLKDLQRFKNLQYVVIKYPYLVPKEINDLDVLLTEKDYVVARKRLRREGFKEVMSEYKEQYKTLMRKFDGTRFLTFHLHRRIAWNGVVALPAKEVLKHKKRYQGTFIPSLEDTYLINMAHVLFEVKQPRPYEKALFRKLRKERLDRKYLQSQLQKAGWYGAFNQLEKKHSKPWSALLQSCKRHPANGLRLGWHYLRWALTLPWPRRGVLVALIGPDGSGKSSIADALKPYKFKRVYFGWKDHILPTSKLIASTGHKRKKNTQANSASPKRPGLVKELVYLNYVLEMLVRVCKAQIRRFKGNVVLDRYFYDIFLQDNQAWKSWVLKLALPVFPKPKHLLYLKAPPALLIKRKKGEGLQKENLIKQQQHIKTLGKRLPFQEINASGVTEETLKHVLQIIWRDL